ncbi:MAG: tetratricopeptide repeat protein [Bdellovibrionales bacterium]
MSRNGLWTVRVSSGNKYGPYNNEKILELISLGVLRGTEFVCQDDKEEYVSISQISEFYDRFLEAWEANQPELDENTKTGHFTRLMNLNLAGANLSNESFSESSKTNTKDHDLERSKTSKDDNESKAPSVSIEQASVYTRHNDSKKDAENVSYREVPESEENTSSHADYIEDPLKGRAVKESSFSKRNHQTKTGVDFDSGTDQWDQTNTKSFEKTTDKRSRKVKKNKNPMFRFVIFIFAGLLALLFYNEHPAKKLRTETNFKLEAPRWQKTYKRITSEKRSEIISRNLKRIEKDLFTEYRAAMLDLNEMMSNTGPSKEALGLQCIVYNKLWNYTKKTGKDLSVVSKVTQRVARLDVGGENASYCRALLFLINTNSRSANRVLDQALEIESNSARLNSLKGDSLLQDGRFEEARFYFQKSAGLWPSWVNSYFQQAVVSYRLTDYARVETLAKNILNAIPEHILSKILLAEVYVFWRQDTELANEILTETVAEAIDIPRLWKSRAFLVLAMIYNSRGDVDSALSYAQSALQLNSRNEAARNMVSVLGGDQSLSEIFQLEEELIDNGDDYYRKENFLAAQAEYKAAFELNPKNSDSAYKAALALWELNQGQEAIGWLQKAIKNNPEAVESYFKIVYYYADQYDFTNANKFLEKSKKYARGDYRFFQAAAYVELQRKSFLSSKKFAEAAIKLYDADIVSHIYMAKALVGSNIMDQAYKTIARAVSLEPSNVDAQALYAEILAKFQGVQIGINYITNLINTYPGVLEYRLSLARIYIDQNKLDEAISVLKPISLARSDFKNVYPLLARAYFLKADPQSALEAFLNMATLDPSDSIPILEIGKIYMATGKFGQALRQFRKLSEINSNYPRVYLLMGKSYFKMGKFKEAAKEAMNEIQRNPRLADAYILHADANLKLRNYSKAISEYQKAVKLRPNSAQAYVKQSIAYRLSGNLDIAEQMLTIAQNKESGYAEIYRELGAILEKKSKNREALEAYRRYLSLNPSARDAKIVQSRIRSLGG